MATSKSQIISKSGYKGDIDSAWKLMCIGTCRIYKLLFKFSFFIFHSGWINALKTVGPNLGAGILMLVVALFLSICAVVNILMLIKVGHLILDSSFDLLEHGLAYLICNTFSFAQHPVCFSCVNHLIVLVLVKSKCWGMCSWCF